MPQPLAEALAELRPALLDLDGLVRAVAAGHRRGQQPIHHRVELRPVDLAAGRRLQIVTSDGRQATTRNLDAAGAAEQIDRLLAEPFGNWHVETADRVIQLRVTKRGAAQVHTAATSRRAVQPRGHDRPKQHLLDPGDPLFSALGAGADKRRQVDAFLRQVAAVLGRLTADGAPAASGQPASAAAGGQPTRPDRPLHLVDLGCGNAYLTFAAHSWLSTRHPVRSVGIDVRDDMVARNRRLAAELDLPDLRFVTGQIAGVDPFPGEPVDVALALHACDTATDDAIAQAVRWGARAILAAPCCHHDVQRQWANGSLTPPHPQAGLVRQPILRARFADVLTDALRADVLRLLGYRVEVVEFVDSRHTPRNTLIRAVRTGAAPSERRRAEFRDLLAAWSVRPALADRLAPELDHALSGDRDPAGKRPAGSGG